MSTLYVPDLLYCGGSFRSGYGLLVSHDGLIKAVLPAEAANAATVIRLQGRALLPGLVNGHSHTFQRLIRGVSESRGASGEDFWAWRNTMYRAAAALEPQDLYDVGRMAFLEMALSGITAVGEFHYLHRDRDGAPYSDPNLLAKTVIEAAKSVGLRICLLRVAYARAGFGLAKDRGQVRFYEEPAEYLENTARLAQDLQGEPSTVSWGVAPHSIRAVTLETLRQIVPWARTQGVPIHMHMAEQPAEIVACEEEHGMSPVRLLGREGMLGRDVTLVHAIHTSPDEVDLLAQAGATICSCPTTERNLGDGIIDADAAIAKGVPFSFGSDSQANIDLLEDARELDHHLRLKQQRRVILDQIDGVNISTRLFGYATAGGARSLGLNTGSLEAGRPADFFTVALEDVSIAGSPVCELLPNIVFALERTAVKDVVVNGRMIVSDGRHELQREIIQRYRAISERVWS